MDCGIGAQASLRDSRPFGVQPSVETLGYSRLSLRDTKAAVFPRRQYSPGVQQYDLWVMTSPGEGEARTLLLEADVIGRRRGSFFGCELVRRGSWAACVLAFGRAEFRRDGAEADDKLDAVGDGHVQARDLPFRDEHEESAGRVRRRGHKHADDVLLDFLLHFPVVL